MFSQFISYHVCQLEDTVVAEQGTVSVWFGSASQVTSPELSTTIYLYSITEFGAKLTATFQSGLLEVYCEAPRAMASLVSQSPRAETSPELKDGQSQRTLCLFFQEQGKVRGGGLILRIYSHFDSVTVSGRDKLVKGNSDGAGGAAPGAAP